MSSKAEVSKILVINSPQELYKIFKDKNISDKEIQVFMDNMDLFINGCTCDSLENWELSVSEYSKLNKYEFTELKKIIGCTGVRLYLDSVFLFEK